jgi:hypothetical protein
MKKISSGIILFLFLFIKSQTQSFSEWHFRYSGYYGYAVGKIQNVKRIMLATGVTSTFEKNIKASLYFTFGVDISSVKYNFLDSALNQGYSNNYFVSIPLTLKKYYVVSKKSHLFWDFGLAPSYQFYTKNEFENGKTAKKRKLGMELEGIGRFGFKTILSKKISFDLGLNGFEKIASISKNDDYKISRKVNSLMMSFYWDIK